MVLIKEAIPKSSSVGYILECQNNYLYKISSELVHMLWIEINHEVPTVCFMQRVCYTDYCSFHNRIR